MNEPRTLRYYGYVERPYEQVRALLQSGALELFQRATAAAAERGRSLVAHLHVRLEGIEIGDLLPSIFKSRRRRRPPG